MVEKNSSGVQKKIELSTQRGFGSNEPLCGYPEKFRIEELSPNPGKRGLCRFPHYDSEKCKFKYSTKDKQIGCNYTYQI